MVYYSKPRMVDYSQFTNTTKSTEAKYGLPKEVVFCKKCVLSNQRPNSAIEYQHTKQSQKETTRIDDEGICEACRVAEIKRKIDWKLREQALVELCNRHRRSDGRYDCLVPGSGGKDSFYAAHILKYKYGMHPLTVTWAPHIYTQWGWDNFQAWLNSGFDNYLCTPNPRVHRLLTRLALENIFHPFQPFMLGQKFLSPKMAMFHDIQLIFFGENPVEYGNSIGQNDSEKMAEKLFSAEDNTQIFLGGVSTESLIKDFGVSSADLQHYIPIDACKARKNNIAIHYLGYYLPWHPQECFYYAVENGGFKPAPERTAGTYSKYSSIDDKIDDFHYYTTYIKFGLGRATYDASQEIRNTEITRDEGVALVKKYDGEWPSRFADEIFRYLSIDPKEYPVAAGLFEQPIMDYDYFSALADQFRSPHLWKQEYGQWKLKHYVFNS